MISGERSGANGVKLPLAGFAHGGAGIAKLSGQHPSTILLPLDPHVTVGHGDVRVDHVDMLDLGNVAEAGRAALEGSDEELSDRLPPHVQGRGGAHLQCARGGILADYSFRVLGGPSFIIVGGKAKQRYAIRFGWWPGRCRGGAEGETKGEQLGSDSHRYLSLILLARPDAGATASGSLIDDLCRNQDCAGGREDLRE